MRVVPINAPSSITPYEGLYVVGNYKKQDGSSSPKLDKDTYYVGERKFNFYNYLQSSAGFEKLKDTYAFNLDPFDFSVAKGNYVMVLPGETATQRTVAFRVETCIFDNATQTGRQQYKQFRIKRNGVLIPEKDSRTNEEGCLIMLGKVSHAFYKIEELKPTVFEIEYDAPNILAKKKGIKTTGKGKYKLTVYTNPWDDKFTFFRDERMLSEELSNELDINKLRVEEKKIESRFFISDFSYQTLRFGYEIDEYMNLTVEKSVLLKLEPWVLRYSGIVPGRNNIQKLRDGLYLLKVAYQKDYLDPAAKGVLIKRETEKRDFDSTPLDLYKAKVWDPYINEYRDLTHDEKRHKTKQHLSIVKKLVRVNNGKIITPITLKVRDLRLMRVRSQMLVQLQPVDERMVQVANAYNEMASERTYAKISEEFKNFLNVNREDFELLLEQQREENDERKEEARRWYKQVYDKFRETQAAQILDQLNEAERQQRIKNPNYIPLKEEQKAAYVEKELESRKMEFDEYLDTFNNEISEIDKARAKYNILTEDKKAEIEQQIKYEQEQLEELIGKLASEKLMPAQKKALHDVGIDEHGRQVVDLMSLKGTEYEELDVFSDLMQQFDIFDNVKGSLLSRVRNRLQLNDFTLASAQAFVEDLDIFVEPFDKSGLRARTFIGPITFILNSNHSSVRPTDNIDEKFCRTDDCDNFKSWGITPKGLYLEEDVPEIKKLETRLKTENLNSAQKEQIKLEIKELEQGSILRHTRNKKYYSSVEHFSGVQVDNLIPTWQQSLLNRKREYEIRSSITNFIDLYGLEFISLGDEKTTKVNNSCKTVYQQGFEGDCVDKYEKYSFTADQIINTFNSLGQNEVGDGSLIYIDRAKDSIIDNFFGDDESDETKGIVNKLKKSKNDVVNEVKKYLNGYELTKEDLKEVIMTGKIKPEIAHGFCGLFIRQLVLGSSKIALNPDEDLASLITKFGDIFGDMTFPKEKHKEISKLKEACFDHETDEKMPSFIVDRRIRIHSLGDKPVFRGGKQMNVNVGAAHSFHRDERFGFARGLNIAAAGRFFTQFISDVTGILKLGIDYTDSKSKAVNTTVQKATFLVMQSAAFDIKLKDYENCAVIRWNPEIFNSQNLFTRFVGVTNNTGRLIYIPGGYFLCAGKEETPPPLYIREHYFYFTQHFTDGDMLDSGDLYNHPWLLGLRGSRDGAAFLSKMATEDYNIADLSTASHDDELWPIKRMIEVYSHILPSFPGMYTLIDQYGEDYPWNELPRQSYKRIQEESLDTNYGRTALGLPDFTQMKRFVEEHVETKVRDISPGSPDTFFKEFSEGGNPPMGEP